MFGFSKRHISQNRSEIKAVKHKTNVKVGSHLTCWRVSGNTLSPLDLFSIVWELRAGAARFAPAAIVFETGPEASEGRPPSDVKAAATAAVL